MSLNKVLGYLSIIILVVFAIITVYSKLVNPGNIQVEKLLDGLYVVMQLLGVAFLLMTTKIKENHKRKMVRLGDLFIVIGIISLIIHLTEIVAYGFISLGLIIIFIDQIFRLRFLKKHLFVERMKILWYTFFYTGVIFKGLHLPGSKILLFVSVIVLWVGIAGYVMKNGLPKFISE